MHVFINELDSKLFQVAQKSHVKIYRDYKEWLQHKDRELKELRERVADKIALQGEQETLIKTLREQIQYEQFHRGELDKCRVSLEKALKNEKRLNERLKNDVLGYRRLAKEEQKRNLQLEAENARLFDEIECLKVEIQAI